MRYEVETQPERPTALPNINCHDDVRRLLAPEMSVLAQEHAQLLLLDTKNNVVGQRVIYQSLPRPPIGVEGRTRYEGNVNSSMVRAAEVLRPAVVEAVPAVIVSRNHPSGDPTPSPEDVAVTRKLAEAAKLLDIDLLDHVVMAGDGAVSLKQRGLMP